MAMAVSRKKSQEPFLCCLCSHAYTIWSTK